MILTFFSQKFCIFTH